MLEMVVRYSKQQIQKMAARGSANGCSVDFLKSQAVAEEVAEKLWQCLRKEKSSLERRQVTVHPSVEHTGTWLVRYRCIPLARNVPGAREINARRGEAMQRAVNASYSSSDLVDSWVL